MRDAPAIGFRYQGSRVLLTAAMLMSSLALVAIWSSAMPYWLCLATTPVVVAWAAAAAVRFRCPRIGSVLWRRDGSVELALVDDDNEATSGTAGEVCASRIIGPLIVLSLRWPPHHRASLWLVPDNLDADTRRRLRMRLAVTGPRPLSGSTDNP